MEEAPPPPATQASPPEAKPKSWALRAAGWLALVGLLAVVIGVFQAISTPPRNAFEALAQGQMLRFDVRYDAPSRAPETPILDQAGAPMRLADARGAVVLVNLWATWCAPCVHEMPTLAELQRAYGDAGLKVVPVSVDEDKAAAKTMLERLSEGALAFYADPEYAFVYAAGAKGFPTTILYDREGLEIGRLAGGADWASPEAKAMIEAALRQ